MLWPLSGRRQRVALIDATDHRRELLVCLGAGALGAYLAVTLIAVPALAAVAGSTPRQTGAARRCAVRTLRCVTLSDRSLEVVRVIVVSPGDVAAERDAVKLVVDDLNRRVAPANDASR